MTVHPELDAEQAYIDHAYDCLEEARASAKRLSSMIEVGRGGTFQARYERDVIQDTVASRLAHLHLGDASLVFGRLDFEPDGRHAAPPAAPGDGDGVLPNASGARPASENGADTGAVNGVTPSDNGRATTTAANGSAASPSPATAAPDPLGPTYYIGRLAVADANQEPVVVDWRAPVAEPFYRATGRAPMGLARRRHFASRGRTLLDIDDELFGRHATLEGDDRISGQGALIRALETARTGRLGDIVGTIQGEQDEIIRAGLPGVLVVQGGPGTGKTVVALHRAAYLLYTHRFPLEDQGVLVVGPNRLFLSYIEQVLPSLGEAGVELVVLADLVDDVRVRGREIAEVARIKGDARMARVLSSAVRDRKRPLRRALEVPYGVQVLRLPASTSEQIVADARRRFRTHNAGRRFVEAEVFAALAETSRSPVSPDELRRQIRHLPEVREALEWMWPVLTPAELLHDLFGSKALLRLAGRKHLRDDEIELLYRPRTESVQGVIWTNDDVPLLDEARALLGPRSRRRSGANRNNGDGAGDELRTYGHIVVDEAQDLSPMQLRMLTRRSLNGSMTVVGDIAQATGAWAHADWDEILDQLPNRRPSRRAELTVGYRIPEPNMALATKVLAVAAPDLTPPRSVREQGDAPTIRQTSRPQLFDDIADVVRAEVDAVGAGNIAVIAPASLVDAIDAALDERGVDHGHATSQGLDKQVTVVPVNLVKGLELDGTVVVEPARIVDEEPQGMRSLYVALTRATKRLTILHTEPLPEPLRVEASASPPTAR